MNVSCPFFVCAQSQGWATFPVEALMKRGRCGALNVAFYPAESRGDWKGTFFVFALHLSLWW
jgi:hypothetical protein